MKEREAKERGCAGWVVVGWLFSGEHANVSHGVRGSGGSPLGLLLHLPCLRRLEHLEDLGHVDLADHHRMDGV